MKSKKNSISKYWLPAALFSLLGIFPAVLLRNHTDLQMSSYTEYIGVIIGSVVTFNIFGFSVLISIDWLFRHYPIYYIKQNRLWWHYGLVACLLFVINYATIVMMRILSPVQYPLRLDSQTFTLILYIWFVEIIIVSLLLSVRSMQYTMSLIKEKRRLEEESMEAKYNALQQQLNPHFLFNSLNTLIAEIEYDPVEAVKFTQYLSDIYRYVLRCQTLKLVTIREELDFVISYVFLHQIRLGNCLNLEINIDEDDMENKIPPLTLQLLVENVIKHNVISEKQPMKMSLESDFESGMLIFKNRLHPKKDVAESGHGLANLAERYRMLNDKILRVKKTDDEFIVFVPMLNDDNAL